MSYGDDAKYSDSQKEYDKNFGINGRAGLSGKTNPIHNHNTYMPKYSIEHNHKPKHSNNNYKSTYKNRYSSKPKSNYNKPRHIIKCPNCGRRYHNSYRSCPHCTKTKTKSNYKPYMKFDDPNFKPNWSCAAKPKKSYTPTKSSSSNNIGWFEALLIIILLLFWPLWLLFMTMLK